MNPSTNTASGTKTLSPIRVRRAQERGHNKIDWLESYHTFSFADYMDVQHMGFGDLRVINEDWVKPGQGFATHGHRDMEILTYVLEGAVEHKDSLGSGSVIRHRTVQRMTAGSGIRHSESNPSTTEPLHLLQIWIFPNENGLTPGYEEREVVDGDKLDQWQWVATPSGKDGSLSIHQDVNVLAAILSDQGSLDWTVAPERLAWIQIARGRAQINGVAVEAGDGIAATDLGQLEIKAEAENTELLLFDLRKLPAEK